MKRIFILVTALLATSLVFAQAPKLKSEEEYKKDSQQICYEKWNKRGELDKRMYNHCVEGQMEGYRDLVHLQQYTDESFYSDTSYPQCLEKWIKRGVADARMIAHCLNIVPYGSAGI